MIKKLLNNRMKIFFFFHLFTLVITGVVSTNHIYYVYHQKESDNFISKIQKFQQNSYCQYYYRYTATETGFGFFAPNVKSMGLFMFDYCDKGIDIKFLTNEGNSRYTTLISNMTDHLDNTAKKKKANKMTKRDLLLDQYGELLIKNVAAKYQSKIRVHNPRCDEVTLKYFLVEYPSLATKSKDLAKKYGPILINVKNWNYEILQ
ncbi:MAG: hypothetical protein KAF41_12275 [Flavobacterium sp.]|nr:hypothetical protein [Flavobacterium sp.]PZO30904.1 MAG: hypothetical protein DCE86_09480 [Flavobacteriaceae bacterium]